MWFFVNPIAKTMKTLTLSVYFFMDILNFINTVGFPIFVAVFFLLKLDNTLQNIGKNLNELTRIIETKLNLDIDNK